MEPKNENEKKKTRGLKIRQNLTLLDYLQSYGERKTNDWREGKEWFRVKCVSSCKRNSRCTTERASSRSPLSRFPLSVSADNR